MANSEQYATMISEMGNETLQAVVNNAKMFGEHFRIQTGMMRSYIQL